MTTLNKGFKIEFDKGLKMAYEKGKRDGIEETEKEFEKTHIKKSDVVDWLEKSYEKLLVVNNNNEVDIEFIRDKIKSLRGEK